MFRRIGRVVVIVALCLSIGSYWALLQSVAWAGMLVENSRHFSLSEAVARTFDGEHPCDLCKRVQQSKKESEPKQNAPAAKKFDLRVVTSGCVLFPPCDFEVQRAGSERAQARIDAPPSPPPRGAVA